MRVKYSISSTVESETFLFSDSRILLVLFLTIIDQKRRAILQEGKLIYKKDYITYLRIIDSLYCRKCEFPMNHHVRLLVGWLVCRSVCHNFLKWQGANISYTPIRTLCFQKKHSLRSHLLSHSLTFVSAHS